MTAVPAPGSARVRARRFAVGLVVLCAALATSACAAGRHAHTAEETPAVDAAGTSVGQLRIQGIAVAAPTGPSYASGGSAELLFIVANNGQQADTLTAVTSSAAGGAGVGAGAPSASMSNPAGGSGTASGSAAGSTSRSASASSSVSSSGSAAASAFTPVEIPAGGRRSFGLGDTADYHLTLTGLTQPLFGGMSIQVTFTFAHAGSTTVTVPVQIAPQTSAPVVTAGESSGETPAA